MASHPTHRVGHSTSSNPAPSAFAAATAPGKRARLRMHPSIRLRMGTRVSHLPNLTKGIVCRAGAMCHGALMDLNPEVT